MLHVCNKLWVKPFPRQEIRLFLPPHARKTQISTFCFFVLPEASDLFTLPAHCRLTTWAWPIPFCRSFFYFRVVFIKSFATWSFRDTRLDALRCRDPDWVRSVDRPLRVTCSFAQIYEPPSRNKRLHFTCSLFLTQNLALRIYRVCRKTRSTWILQGQS